MSGEEVAGCFSPSSAKSSFRELDDEFLQVKRSFLFFFSSLFVLFDGNKLNELR